MQKSRQQLVVGLAAVAALAFIPAASARQSSTSSQQSSAAQSANPNAAEQSDQQDALAAAARKAKEQQSHAKPAKVFTNDNLPTKGVVSTVGTTPAADATASTNDAKAATTAPAPQGEQYWRDKFATLNKKLEQAQAELDVMQRELGQLNLQNYSNPNDAMQQSYSRGDIDKKTAEISAKQKEIDDDKQAISDAESDLRKSGGDPGWER
jgi:hypothetical protein